MRLFSIALAIASLSCVTGPSEQQQVVLEIGGKPFTYGEFEQFVQSSVQQDEPIVAGDILAGLFEQFIEEQLLLRAADELAVPADPESVAGRVSTTEPAQGGEPRASSHERITRAVSKRARIEALVEARLSEALAVSDEEIEAHYEAHRAYFERPETVSVSQILLEELPDAEDVLAQLKADVSRFEELARKRSTGPEASRGGLLGSFSRGELPPTLEEAVFSLRPNSVSEIVVTDFGYHIFRVHEISAAEPLPLEAVRDTIRVELLRDKSERELERFIDELERTYPVTIHREHLNFAFLDWDDDKSTPAPTEENP